jgi:ABC-type transport system substrate-binding protein
MTRASSWDPPVLDPRLTQSVGLFQFAGLTSNRLVRYVFPDEASGANDLALKGDLAESWQSSADNRVWTFKLRQGVKWQNVPPLNGRELVAADVKYCFEAYAKEGVQSFNFQEIEGMETPDKHTLRVHLNTPNVLFPQNLAEPVTVIFAREVLEEDGDLKKRLIGTGPYVLKEHTRKVRVVLARNPDYFDKGRQYLDEYVILSTPDAATRLAAFRTGQSDILWVASLSEAETVRKTNSAAVVQGIKSVLAPFGLTLAQDKPPFNDVRVRRAISMAIDRQKQVDTGLRGPRHPRLGRPLHLLPGHDADGGPARPVVAVPSGGGEEAARRGRASQRVRDDALLLRVLPADDLAGAARPAGSEEEPQHQPQDHQARLHELLRAATSTASGTGWPGGSSRATRWASTSGPISTCTPSRPRTSSASTTPSSTSWPPSCARHPIAPSSA